MNKVLLHPNSLGNNLTTWRISNGGKGLERALKEPDKIIAWIKESGLRGMGGSGFPVYKKWQFISEQAVNTDKYLICNGNEDEPGTFKDAYLLSRTPNQVIEGALIAAIANGINKIIFYINPEQKESIETIRSTLQQWQESDLFHSVVEQIGRPMTIEVMESSGHYIGGEETAAIESVEGKFPFPRGKPPYPAVAGVHNCPTLINNVETLANVPHILRHGASWYRELGRG